MKSKIESLYKNNTWQLVIPPLYVKILQGRWVYHIKQGTNDTPVQYKVRWVAKSYLQWKEIDFDDLFASVVKATTFKILFILTVYYDWELELVDIKTAFLYAPLTINVYMK